MIVSNLLIFVMLYASSSAVAVDRDEYRSWARNFLAQHGVVTDNDSLLRAVEGDKRPFIRSIAADLLTNLKEPRAASLLRARLAAESDETVRAHFAGDLLKLEGRSARGLARSTLDTLKELEARMRVARGLAESGDLSGYADVVSGLKSDSSRTHLLAAQDLVAFVKACKGRDLKPEPLDVALGLLEDPSAAVRLSAAIAIAERLGDDPRSEAALRKLAAQDGDSLARSFAATSLQLWSLKMKGKNAGGRQ
jgi:HEAT repeat protein